jgi:hypothetical protein
MKRVPLATLLFATFAVAALALTLPLIAVFSGPARRAPEKGEPAR